MPNIDLDSNINLDNTPNIKFNVYKSDGFSFFNWFSKKNKNDPTKNLHCNIKLDVEDQDKLKINTINFKKLQNLDEAQKTKLLNVLNQKNFIDLNSREQIKEIIERTTNSKKVKQSVKCNSSQPYTKQRISTNSTMSIMSKKSVVTTNLKYRVVKTSKSKIIKPSQTNLKSNTRLKSEKSNETVITLKSSPIKQNILVKSVPSKIRRNYVQRKLSQDLLPVYMCKNQTLNSCKPVENNVPEVSNRSKDNMESSILPMLITKIKSMEKQITGIENTTKEIKEVVAERKLAQNNLAHKNNNKSSCAASLVTHKIYTKNVKPKRYKHKTKSKTNIFKDEGYQFKYPNRVDFKFCSKIEKNNTNDVLLNNTSGNNQYSKISSGISLSPYKINLPINIPNNCNDLCVHVPNSNNEYDLLLNMIKTLSKMKNSKIEYSSCQLPSQEELDFNHAESQQIKNDVETTENSEEVETTEVLQKNSMPEVEEKYTTRDPDSNEVQLKIETEPEMKLNSNEENKILLEILSSQRRQNLIINKMLKKAFNTDIQDEKHEMNPVDETSKEKTESDISEYESVQKAVHPQGGKEHNIDDEENISNDDVSEYKSKKSESMKCLSCQDEIDEEIDNFDPRIGSSEVCCDVDTKHSFDSEISLKTELMDKQTDVSSNMYKDPKVCITIFVGENLKDEVKMETNIATDTDLINAREVVVSKTKNDDVPMSPLCLLKRPCGDHNLDFGGPVTITKSASFFGNVYEVNYKSPKKFLCEEPQKLIKPSDVFPKSNFYTEIEASKESDSPDYFIDSRGEYLDHEKRRALDEKIQGVNINKSVTESVKPNLKTLPSRQLSNASSNLEPYGQFIETSFMSEKTSYSKTKYNVRQDKEVKNNLSLFNSFTFKENSAFPIMESVTSENKLDVTAKFTSKQHIICRRNNDLPGYSGAETSNTKFRKTKRKIPPTSIEEERRNILQKGNQNRDIVESRRRPCKNNLTLHRKPIMEDIEESLIWNNFNLNKHQGEKGDCFNINDINDYNLSLCHLMNNNEVKSEMLFDALDETKSGLGTQFNMSSETISTAVQTDWSIFDCQFNSDSFNAEQKHDFKESKTIISDVTGDPIGKRCLVTKSCNDLKLDVRNEKIVPLDNSTVKKQQSSNENTEQMKILGDVKDKDLLTIKIQKGDSELKVSGILLGIIEDKDGRKRINDTGLFEDPLYNIQLSPKRESGKESNNVDIHPKETNFNVTEVRHCCSIPCLTTVSLSEETVKSDIESGRKIEDIAKGIENYSCKPSVIHRKQNSLELDTSGSLTKKNVLENKKTISKHSASIDNLNKIVSRKAAVDNDFDTFEDSPFSSSTNFSVFDIEP